MTYNEYLKEKIINLYLVNKKIGKHSVTLNDFNFLDQAFSKISNTTKLSIYEAEQLFSYIESDLKNNLILRNKIGLDFEDKLKIERKSSSIFLKETSLKTPQITFEQEEDLKKKYIAIANEYGLKEFYYTLNPQLTPEENYHKALLLLHKTQKELEKIKNVFKIQDSYQIGNNILSIQVNWQEELNNNGYYNYCSNTICLKDERSTFPLIHEFIHFIDKTTTSLLITGKTSQQLYEEKLFSQKELFDNFDMSVFSHLKLNSKNFPWIEVIKLRLLFNEEITQNKYIQAIFNQFDIKKDYQNEFKNIIINWIEEKKYPNSQNLINDVNLLIHNKTTNLNLNNNFYNHEEINILSLCCIFNTFDLSMNNYKNWSEELDSRFNKLYYSTQKEMLARTCEHSINGNLEQLSDRLSTPKLNTIEQEKLFHIIKSWMSISEDIIKLQNKEKPSHRIINIRHKLEKKPAIISNFKLNQ